MRTHIGLAVLSTLSFTSACTNTTDGPTSDSSDLTGGFPATSHQFDAVGDIGEVMNNPAVGTKTFDAKCSGILIGPHTVLTASHCANKYAGRDSFKYTEHYFRIGAHSATPTETVRIIGYTKGPNDTGGVIHFGSDIAIFQLSDDITDVTPMPIGAPPSAAEIGNNFLAVGYGRQAINEPAGTFDVRSMGTMQLIALTGNPLHAIWPSIDAMMAFVHLIIPTATTAQFQSIWDSSLTNLIAGQAFFSGMKVHGVDDAPGDSGGPMLRRTSSGLEIVGIVSGGFSVNGRVLGGTYYGIPGTPDNLTYIDTQLADPTRGISEGGYCNATTAIRSAQPNESLSPIDMFDCASIGMVCDIEDNAATCTDPVTSGPASTCSLSGKTYNITVASGTFPAKFNTDGTWTFNNHAQGTYTLANGIFTADNFASCPGSPGSYVATFSADCTTLSVTMVQDTCELRAESYDGGTGVLQP